MKNTIAFTLVLAFFITAALLSGCQNKKAPEETGKSTQKTSETATVTCEAKTAFNGKAGDILDQIIKKAIELDTDKEYGIESIECSHNAIDSDNCTDILGLTTEEFTAGVEEAVESKPEGSWFTHSIVVVKAKDGTDAAALAEKIVKNTKPNRFGCLKPEAIVGGYAGQYIVFTASSSTSCEAVYQALSALSAIAPTRIDRTNDWSGGGLNG
ncbi:MAG: hypothetical protein VB118_06235 [Oscillospiraceae bacterium]|nr:hypothetical protein [Oscillospiraceae bacterium]